MRVSGFTYRFNQTNSYLVMYIQFLTSAGREWLCAHAVLLLLILTLCLHYGSTKLGSELHLFHQTFYCMIQFNIIWTHSLYSNILSLSSYVYYEIILDLIMQTVSCKEDRSQNSGTISDWALLREKEGFPYIVLILTVKSQFNPIFNEILHFEKFFSLVPAKAKYKQHIFLHLMSFNLVK